MGVGEEEVGLGVGGGRGRAAGARRVPVVLAIAAAVGVEDGIGAEEPGLGGRGDFGHAPAAVGDEGGDLGRCGGGLVGVVVDGIAGTEEVVHGFDGTDAGDDAAFIDGGAERFDLERAGVGVRRRGRVEDVAVQRPGLGAQGVDGIGGEGALFAAEERADDDLIGSDGGGGLGEFVVVVDEVEVERDAELLEAGGADGGAGLGAGAGERGQDQADEQRDDGDDDEEFDEREGAPGHGSSWYGVERGRGGDVQLFAPDGRKGFGKCV